MTQLQSQHTEAYDYLSQINPQYWSNSAFPGPNWGHVTNNLSERAVKFIGSDQNDGRKQPITRLLDDLIYKVKYQFEFMISH